MRYRWTYVVGAVLVVAAATVAAVVGIRHGLGLWSTLAIYLSGAVASMAWREVMEVAQRARLRRDLLSDIDRRLTYSAADEPAQPRITPDQMPGPWGWQPPGSRLPEPRDGSDQ